MRHRSFFRILMLGLAIGIALCTRPGECLAQGSLTVHAGYDLFETTPASFFPGLGNLVGVPLGTFPAITPGSLGNTDTIVQRLSDVTVAAVGDTGSTDLLLRALQMETAVPVNFMGQGLDNYFVTLTPTAASTGTMNITFASTAGGTFTSSLDVFFDVHKGSLTGMTVFSSEAMLSNSGAPWERIPPPGAWVIDGINHNLNGKNMDQDFWPGVSVSDPQMLGLVTENSGGVHHVVMTATPEPTTWVMCMMAGLIVPAYLRWGRRRV